MIVFANGAMKSGSTWLMHIALQLRPGVEPPQEYWNPRWTSRPHFSIDRGRLHQFLKDPTIGNTDMVLKFHDSNPADQRAMLADPRARVLNIRRDVRDVVVSMYHHLKIAASMPDFDTYYWKQGRAVAWKNLRYHMVWNIRSPRYLCLEYDELLSDFAGQVRRVAQLLEVAVDDQRIAEIRRATSPESLNEQYTFSDLNRFRKGGSGDWQNHLTAAHLADIEYLTAAARRLPVRLAFNGPRVMRALLKRWGRVPRRAV